MSKSLPPLAPALHTEPVIAISIELFALKSLLFDL